MGSLETKLHGLTWGDGGVPAQASGAVRIATSDCSVPTADHLAAAGVRPIHCPAVDIASAIIGDANRAGEATAPLVTDHITATTASSGNR